MGPLAMEVDAPDIQGLDLRFADLDAGRVVVRVPVTVDIHPCDGFCETDLADDGCEGLQGFAAPVPAEMLHATWYEKWITRDSIDGRIPVFECFKIPTVLTARIVRGIPAVQARLM